jgi:hypothetical protein
MELLGDVGHANLVLVHLETVSVGARQVHGLHQTYNRSGIVLDAPDGTLMEAPDGTPK